MEKSLLEIYSSVSIQQYKTDVGFKTLVEGVRDNLYVIPEFQRKYRWNKEQVEELASSLFRDLPIPPIYTFRNENGQMEILDGQQRVMSLYFYFIGKFFRGKRNAVFDYRELDTNSGQNFEEMLEDKYHNIVPTRFYMRVDGKEYDISYATLPAKIQKKIDYTYISVIEIKIADKTNRDAILHKIFTNINNGGTELSSQELRNGIYPCKFGKMINEVNTQNKNWRKAYGKIDDKCRDVEMLYRFCALKKYVKYRDLSFEVSEYPGTIGKFIDNFTECAFSFSDMEIEEYRESLEKFLSMLNTTPRSKKVQMMEGLFVVFEKTDLKFNITDELCEKIQNCKEVSDKMSSGTVSLTKMTERWKKIYEFLSENDKKNQ